VETYRLVYVTCEENYSAIMAVARAPKQWSLTKNETVNSFENWKQKLQYTLASHEQFATFLVDGVTWLKRKANPTRDSLMTDVKQSPLIVNLHSKKSLC